MSTVLGRIADSVRARLEERKARLPARELERRCAQARKPHDFAAAFGGPGIHVIAEIKFSSPSQGALADGTALSPVEAARAYLDNGAAALSILTEQDHFNGKLEYLEAVRGVFPEARLLLKDFVIDEYQLAEARVRGADAALLIVALLGEARTAELLAECRRLGLTALVEVHDERELEAAARAGARLIGVNNRDLKTLEISLETSYRLLAKAPRGATLVSESGLSRGEELGKLRQAGYHGFLIGTTFMKTGRPGEALARMLREAKSG
jgi:indole-3-glycerol phosphate synthase